MARKKNLTLAEYDKLITDAKNKIEEAEAELKDLKAELTGLELAKMTQFLKETEGEDGKSLYDQYTEAESK